MDFWTDSRTAPNHLRSKIPSLISKILLNSKFYESEGKPLNFLK